MHDIVLRNAKIVDGSGAPVSFGDVAIEGEKIVAVGEKLGRGKREIDADGLMLSPGWVDVHTHYDGQATWDPYLTPSCWHGVTTAVMGNCGVGFAPVREEKRDWLIGLMEGVEDIPGAALAEGIDWSWESFPEYLDALDKSAYALDLAAQVPHGAVRAYVMGERGATDAQANEDERAAMANIVQQAVAAGAVGFTTSRTVLHRSIDGEVVPGTDADALELLTIAKGMRAAGSAVFEVASDLAPESNEFDWMDRIIDEMQCPVTYACVQNDEDPAQWRRLIDYAAKRNGQGMYPQVAIRPPGMLMCFSGSHPFVARPSYQAIAHLPLAARIVELRKPETRTRILNEATGRSARLLRLLFIEGKEMRSTISNYERIFVLGDPPNYEPGPELSVTAIAARRGISPEAAAYDCLLELDGKAFLYTPLFNYSAGNYDVAREMMVHPSTVLGISDGGAHCGVICDASAPTYLLSHFVRDRDRGPRIALEHAVKMQTRDTAMLYGFKDRGLIAPGMRADINLINFEELALPAPEMVADLPASGKRLIQRASGYHATLLRGAVTFQHGEATGELPGRLIRGRQAGLS
ncbi:MAG: amidohydrolase family protein [Proteobacteria bacterium]|nr:amidohydrolase family protein [Pseudomonadota bacterium]